MIQYEMEDSPFFEANKSYCETVESQLAKSNAECFGFCNCFGYDVESSWNKNNRAYKLKFHKHQTTENGMIIPVNAHNYADVKLTMEGLSKKIRIVFSRSVFRRFLISKKRRKEIPSPYFVRFSFVSGNQWEDTFVKQMLRNNVSKFTLQNGRLECMVQDASIDPLNLIHEVENTIKNLV